MKERANAPRVSVDAGAQEISTGIEPSDAGDVVRKSDPIYRSLACQVLVQLFRRIVQIAFIDDVVTLEHAPRLVPADEHGHLFTHASPDQIAGASAPEINIRNGSARDIVF